MDKFRIPDIKNNTIISASESKKHLNVLQSRANATPGFYIPSGVILPYAGDYAPIGYLLCDGQSVSYNDYKELFDVISYTYTPGTPSGTYFNLPDLRGRAIVAPDSSAGRVSTNNTLGATSGEEKHTLSTAELPSHRHAITLYSRTNFTASGSTPGSNLSATGNTEYTEYTGSNTPHNNMQPYLVINYVIKT